MLGFEFRGVALRNLLSTVAPGAARRRKAPKGALRPARGLRPLPASTEPYAQACRWRAWLAVGGGGARARETEWLITIR